MAQTAVNDFPKYTKVLKEAMEGLKMEELGLYTHMRSQNQETWQFNIEYMAHVLSCSVYKARQILNNLISKGLVERIQARVKGCIAYIYKVRDRKGQVKDDAKLMRKKVEEVETKTIQIEEIKPTPVVVEEVKKEVEKVEEKRDWRELFKGNEQFINAFIADRKKHLSNTDYYKKNLGRAATDLEVESHINRKLNDKTSDMEARIKEFIATELQKEKNKTEQESAQTISDVRKLEIEKNDKILIAKTKLSKERFPEHWAEEREFGDREWLLERKRLEATIKSELDAIEEKYNQEYKALLGVITK